jgi:hypothetical protein
LLGSARAELREELERASKHYRLTTSVDGLARHLEPYVQRIIKIGGARIAPFTSRIHPVYGSDAFADVESAMKTILPAGRRRNRQARTWAKYILSPRLTRRGAEPTVRPAAVLLGMLAIEDIAGLKFAWSRNEWTGKKATGPMLHLLQALLLIADACRWLTTGGAHRPAPLSLEALAHTVNEIRLLRRRGLPADYGHIDLDNAGSIEAHPGDLGHLLTEERERRWGRRKKRPPLRARAVPCARAIGRARTQGIEHDRHQDLE